MYKCLECGCVFEQGEERKIAMPRYIDADALMDKVRNLSCGWDEYEAGKEAVVGCIAYADEIDAVPVVRCGECRFRNTSWYDKRDMLESFCRWDRDESPNDDDYCSYGERRKARAAHE